MIRPTMSHIKKHTNTINMILILTGVMIFSAFSLSGVHLDLDNSDSYNEWVTSASLRGLNNWLADGILKDKFLIHEDFSSIEFGNNNHRGIYVSYPPGALVPVYLIAKLSGKNEISVRFVKRFIQAEYYLAAAFLSLLFYSAMIILEVKSRALFLLLPIVLSSLWMALPFNVYYMQNVYFADQAVILLSIIYFFLEILLYNNRLKKYENLLQLVSSLVLLLGLLTDYYFVCIALVTFFFRVKIAFQDYPLKSILYKIFSKTWMIILSSFAAGILFISQILIVPNGLKLLIVTFLIRTGSGAEHGGIKLLALHHFKVGFSPLFLPVLAGVTVFCLIFPLIKNKFNKQKQMIIDWLSIITLSSVLHTLILREHSIVHEFSMLKYNLVFVFFLFTIVYWIYVRQQQDIGGKNKRFAKIALTLLSLPTVLLFLYLYQYNQTFTRQRFWKEDHSIARFIGENTNFADVVYSPDYEIPLYPPQNLTISKKRIYRISSFEAVPVKELPNHAFINLFISKETLSKHPWNKMDIKGIDRRKVDGYYLLKFPKKLFEALTIQKNVRP